VSKKKIPVSGDQQPLTANPFAALELAGLPVGPDEPPATHRPSMQKAGRIVLRREKARRGGKTVIVVGEFAPHFTVEDIEDFARKAKQVCGCGGTVSGREIELQGDDPLRVRNFFEGEGFRVGGI
jgi:translation initiation factor 1